MTRPKRRSPVKPQTKRTRQRTASRRVKPSGKAGKPIPAFLEKSPVLMWVSEPDGRRSYFNRAWLAFTGRSLGEECGHGWNENVHADDLSRCLLAPGEASGHPFQVEYRLRCGTGEYRWVRETGSPRFSPSGTWKGYIGSCFVMQDAEAAAEEHRHNGSHEQCSQESAAEPLPGEGLPDTPWMERFRSAAGDIAHDLNNVFNNILGFTYLLKKYADDRERTVRYSEALERAVRKGAGIVERLPALGAAGAEAPVPSSNVPAGENN